MGVAFCDGSLDAHAVCVYARSEGEDEWGEKVVDTRLLFAKSRVAPLGGTTISKMELQALVQATRSLLKLVRAVQQRVSRVILCSDSMCTLMSMRREGGGFKPYFQN